MGSSVRVDVPVRACDVGGWSDTWFAGHGAVCSLAIGPGVTVDARATPGAGEVTIALSDYGVTFAAGSEPPEHRLIVEAVREAGDIGASDVEISVLSAVPASSSLGTSASVCVGVIAALDALRGPIRSPRALAVAAHRAESDRLGRQSGVQDQIAAAHGGANLIEISRYPTARAQPLAVSAACWSSLDERLCHVAYGSGHDSSAVHEEVIAALAEEGPSSARLARLRELAGAARDALEAGDLDRYGRVLSAATDAQAALHPALVSDDARALVDLARSCGALGWKVNGAGGAGGSISVVCRDPSDVGRVADGARGLGHMPLSLGLARHGARLVSL